MIHLTVWEISLRYAELTRRIPAIAKSMAPRSPVLMVYPGARLLRLTKYGPELVTVKDTDHYKIMREFCDHPKGFVDAAIKE